MTEHKSRWPAWAREFSDEVRQHLNRMEKHIMTDQAKLDADVQALSAGIGAVEKEISDLKNQPQAAALDFTALDAAVAKLQSDGPPAPVPVVPVVDPTPPTA